MDKRLNIYDQDTLDGINVIVDSAKNELSIAKVILFGSRALGVNHPKSDFDVAFEWTPTSNESWGAFAQKLREDFPMLNSLDLVKLDEIDLNFRRKIESEGVLLYERK